MNKRDVQEGCANRLYRVCTHSSNTGDENMDVLQLIMSLVSVYETGFVLRTLTAAFWTICSLFIKRAEQPPNKALQ